MVRMASFLERHFANDGLLTNSLPFSRIFDHQGPSQRRTADIWAGGLPREDVRKLATPFLVASHVSSRCTAHFPSPHSLRASLSRTTFRILTRMTSARNNLRVLIFASSFARSTWTLSHEVHRRPGRMQSCTGTCWTVLLELGTGTKLLPYVRRLVHLTTAHTGC